jgi:hypothetical protein
MHTARVSLLFVCRSKKVESYYVQVSLCMADGRRRSSSSDRDHVIVVVKIHCKTKATQQASQAKQSKAIGARRSRQYAHSKRKQQK